MAGETLDGTGLGNVQSKRFKKIYGVITLPAGPGGGNDSANAIGVQMLAPITSIQITGIYTSINGTVTDFTDFLEGFSDQQLNTTFNFVKRTAAAAIKVKILDIDYVYNTGDVETEYVEYNIKLTQVGS